jgi:hypothetical protein
MSTAGPSTKGAIVHQPMPDLPAARLRTPCATNCDSCASPTRLAVVFIIGPWTVRAISVQLVEGTSNMVLARLLSAPSQAPWQNGAWPSAQGCQRWAGVHRRAAEE